MKKVKIDKKEICKLNPSELLSRITVEKLGNTRSCIIEFDGQKYISKSCGLQEIDKKIKKQCNCSCGGNLLL